MILDEIIDLAKSRGCLGSGAVVSRGTSPIDGNPYYLVTIAGLTVTVFEQTKWKDEKLRNAPAARMVALVKFKGTIPVEPLAWLRRNYEFHGLPSLGIDNEGKICLYATFPVPVAFQVDLALQQLVVSLDLIVEHARDLLAAWNDGSKRGAKRLVQKASQRHALTGLGEVGKESGLVLDELFNPLKEWGMPSSQCSVRRRKGLRDKGSYFELTVNGT
jgi:hypothetical protein